MVHFHQVKKVDFGSKYATTYQNVVNSEGPGQLGSLAVERDQRLAECVGQRLDVAELDPELKAINWAGRITLRKTRIFVRVMTLIARE